jgi:6-phosphogluconolactonase
MFTDTPTDTETTCPNAHQVILGPSSTIALVACKATDVVQRYLYDAAAGSFTLLSPVAATLPNSSGPRHVAFDAQGTHVYVLNETASTLFAYSYAPTTGVFTLINSLSSRAPSMTGTNTAAEVAVLDDFIYVSNRGDNTIGLFHIGGSGDITLVTHFASGGMTPRHFFIDPSSRWLIVANQATSSLAVFGIDPTTRMLLPVANPATSTPYLYVGIVGLP